MYSLGNYPRLPHCPRILILVSFGNQGAAQAQNLRDSGIPNDSILIANREDSYANDAKAKGFIVEHNFEKAASLADGEPITMINLCRLANMVKF